DRTSGEWNNTLGDVLPRHPAPGRGDGRAGAAGATFRVRPRSVRLLLRACRRSRDSIVHHAALARHRQVADDARRVAVVLRAEDETGETSGSAPTAGSDDCGASRAMWLLLQRTDHQRRGAAIQES